MKIERFVLLVVFALLAGALHPTRAATIAPVKVTGTIEWIYDYEEGRKLARESGPPMFVVFRCER